MMPESSNPLKPSFVGSLRLVLICATIGVVTGFAWAIVTIIEDYLVPAGLWKTGFYGIRDRVTYAGLAGTLSAVLFVLLRSFVAFVVPAVNQVLSFSFLVKVLRDSHLKVRLYLICQTCGLIVLGVLSVMKVGPGYIFDMTVTAFFFCAVIAISRRAALASSDPFGPDFTACLASCYASLTYLLCGCIFLQGGIIVLGFLCIDSVEKVFALLLCSFLVFFLVRWHVAQAWKDNHAADDHRRMRPILLLFVASFLLPGTFWVLSPFVSHAGRQPTNPKNIILIAIDTLRSDHISVLGEDENYHRDLTPNLRGLAARGTVFRTAISQAPWTKPAMASILTGKYPQEHEAILLHGALGAEQTTLAELLTEAGYSTGAVVSSALMNAECGFDQGFDYFSEDYVLSNRAITSEGITDQAIQFLKSRNDDRFFLLLHYFDPHYEYRNHEDWVFADDYSRWLVDWDIDLKIEASALRDMRHLLEPSDIKYLTDLYDEEIAYTDREIGRLFDYIREQQLEQNTAIVIVADHGEEFMERGWLGHCFSLYDEQIKVPLIMVFPGLDNSNNVVSETVETRPIFSTILEYLGLPFDEEQGPPSLLPMIRDTATDGLSDQACSAAYSSTWIPDSRVDLNLSSLQTDDWKVILDHTRGRELLFDLTNDPGETTNLALENPEKLEEMLQKLNARLERIGEYRTDIPRQAPGQEKIDSLRALGYL